MSSERILPRSLRSRLRARYDVPERHYHTWAHVQQVLADVERLLASGEPRAEVEDPDAVRLAAVFHDAVYDARAGDNEERSAALADAWLSEHGVPPARRQAVRRLVVSTREHWARRPDEAVLCDADLAVLAAPPEGYEAYRRAVRAEYAWLSEHEWRSGRAEVLTDLASRRPLYATEAARAWWEAAAHRNLAAELAALRRPGTRGGLRLPW